MSAKRRKADHLTLADLRLYCKICDVLPKLRGQGASLNNLARKLHRPVSVIYQLLKKQLRDFGVDAVSLADETRGHHQLTPEGKDFYKQARKVLEEYARLDQWRVQAMHEVRVGTTNSILVNALPRAISKYIETHGDIRLTFVEEDHPQIIDDLVQGNIHFGIGPSLTARQARNAKRNGVELEPLLEPLGRSIDMVFVCHPAHTMAGKLASQSQDGKPTEVQLAEIEDVLLVYLPPDVQPGVFDDPAWRARLGRHNRLEVSSYSTVLAYVQMNVGVGVVPGWFWVLNELRRQGQLVYAPIEKLPPIDISIYRRPAIRLSEAAEDLLKTVKEHMQELELRPLWREPATRNVMPRSLEDYTSVYWISRNRLDVPVWRSGTLALKQKGTRLTGKQTDLMEDHEAYGLRGTAEGALVQWTARAVRNANECYVAVLNACQPDGTLIGCWAGRDSMGAPICAPMVASKHEMELDAVRELTRNATLRFVGNAGSFAPYRMDDVPA